MKDLIIIGAGCVGRETALIVEEMNEIREEWNLLGFIDEDVDLQNQSVNGHYVLGDLEFLKEYKREIFVVCAMSCFLAKKRIVESLKKNENIKFATLIHPSTKVNSLVQIGEGCIIYQNAVMTIDIKVGNHVMISPNTGIGHDSIIEDYCSVLWGVNISGNVKLEEGVLVGSGATIIQELEIGSGTVIGAGAVVIRNLPSHCTAVGNPSKIIRRNAN